MGIIDKLRDSRDTDIVYSEEYQAACPCGKGTVCLLKLSKFEDFPKNGTASYVSILCEDCEEAYDIEFDNDMNVKLVGKTTFTPKFEKVGEGQ